MDKLEPVLKQKYWIIAGLALLIPLVGWFKDSSEVKDTIEKRWQTLSSLSVPKVNAGQTPNQQFIDALANVNKVQAERQSQVEKLLYATQQDRKTWPAVVRSRMTDVKYREKLSTDVLQLYRQRGHSEEMRKVLDIVDPFYEQQDEEGNITSHGKVIATTDSIPHVDFLREYPNSLPDSKIVWDTQEDVWLTRSILEAIAKVNEGADKLSDTAVRQIVELSLHGGDRSRLGEDGARSSGDSGAGDSDMSTMMETMGNGSERGARGGDVYGGAQRGPAGINLASILGPDDLASSGDSRDERETGGFATLGGTGGSRGVQAKKRYVDDDEEMPYKTRAFYLKVLVRHERLPELQAELVSMVWPTELLMIHHVILHEDFAGTRGGVRSRDPMGRPGGGLLRGAGTRGPLLGSSSNDGGREAAMAAMSESEGIDGSRGIGSGGVGVGVGNGMRVRGQNNKAVDEYVAMVEIVGLMTIYRTPEELNADPEQPQNDVSGQPQDTAGTTPEQPAEDGKTGAQKPGEGKKPEETGTDAMNPDQKTTPAKASGEPVKEPASPNGKLPASKKSSDEQKTTPADATKKPEPAPAKLPADKQPTAADEKKSN